LPVGCPQSNNMSAERGAVQDGATCLTQWRFAAGGRGGTSFFCYFSAVSATWAASTDWGQLHRPPRILMPMCTECGPCIFISIGLWWQLIRRCLFLLQWLPSRVLGRAPELAGAEAPTSNTLAQWWNIQCWPVYWPGYNAGHTGHSPTCLCRFHWTYGDKVNKYEVPCNWGNWCLRAASTLLSLGPWLTLWQAVPQAFSSWHWRQLLYIPFWPPLLPMGPTLASPSGKPRKLCSVQFGCCHFQWTF
jgi:hypothetical protein